MISAPIRNGFWDPLGLHFATIFGFQKWIEKHPSSKDPCRDIKWKTQQSDAKWKPSASKMEPEWNQNEAKRQPPGGTRGKKTTTFECKSGFQLRLQTSNEVWSYRVSKNMAVQVTLTFNSCTQRANIQPNTVPIGSNPWGGGGTYAHAL